VVVLSEEQMFIEYMFLGFLQQLPHVVTVFLSRWHISPVCWRFMT